MEVERKSRKPPPIERKPTMLKEFLRDDFSSCSSNGFRSFPRRSCYTSMRSLLEMDLKAKDTSKKPPTKPLSAFQKASVAVISMVKHFQFSQRQSLLPRSFSRRLIRSFTRKNEEKVICPEIKVVKVKDILRWKSFRDVLEEKEKVLLDCSTQTTFTTTTATTTSNNSWSDSDFTSELHSSSGSSDCSVENEIEDCKKYLPERKKISKRRCGEVGEDSIEKSLEVSKYEEKDQFSPVSVLNFPFEEDDESSSSLQSSLESMQKTKHKLMQKIKRFESLAKIEPMDLEKQFGSVEQESSSEYPSDAQSNCMTTDTEVYREEDSEYTKAEEKAMELLKLFNGTDSKECVKDTANFLLLDFFREEIIERILSGKGDDDDCRNLLKVATDCMNGNTVVLDWGVVESRGVHIKEMERGGMWREFEEEKKELALEMEIGVFNLLMDEMLFDLLS